MSKPFAYIIILISVILIVINAFKLDFEQLFEEDSLIGLIGITASLCAIVIMLIFLTSKKIEDKVGGK
ncbi:MAG: hypothetical protein ISP67_02450 [Flavobacteriaceae bacterium]|jgi:hypothetical protein|nr:hypothetical protein [Flavobacteriaceae bacterium]